MGSLFSFQGADYGRKTREEAALRKFENTLAPDVADQAILAAKRKKAEQLLPQQGRGQTFLTAGLSAPDTSRQTLLTGPMMKKTGGY